MTSRAYMRAELAALSDEALFARTVEAVRLARSNRDAEGRYTDLDRAWCDVAWATWCERDKSGRYAEAVRQAREEVA